MNPRLTCIRALCALSCLFAQIVVFSAPAALDENTTTVRMDGKNIYIPELKLTKKTNPVTEFLYIGSWTQEKKSPAKSLCEIDSANNTIRIKSPEALLENSRTRVLTPGKAGSFFDRMPWGRRQATHIAFNVMSDKRQPAVIEVSADSDVVMFHNGKPAASVPAGSVLVADGNGYLPVMLEKGANIINTKLFSNGRPSLRISVCLDHSHDLAAAWQPQGGLLKKLIITPRARTGVPTLEWSPALPNLSISLEVRDVATNSIILQKESVRQGRVSNDDEAAIPPGIYEAVYRFKDESASEFFVVGNARDQYARLENELSIYDIDPSTKPDIEAQQRRAQILLAEKNFDILDREWQEKLAYALGCLASINHKLGAGEPGFIKDQVGMQIKGYVSKLDGSGQFYRLFVPSNYNPNASLPLLVIIPTMIANKERPFIEGPVMANQREALLWAKYAEQHGFAVLWPGYRGVPEGYSCESTRMDEAIQAVEKNYNIDPRRIIAYGTCSGGYNAGRLVSEYPNRYAAIVYDGAVFTFKATTGELSPSIKAWYEAIDPVRHVLENRNLKIFVLHDNTKRPGHGEMELSIRFLAQAKTIRNDITSYLDEEPLSETARMDMIFSWITPCRNEHPGSARSSVAAKAGYTGPISEIFTTPILIVKGTHATGRDLQAMSDLADSIRSDYHNYFHGAQCSIKNDDDVTQDDIASHSLILIGNPQGNSVWLDLQARIQPAPNDDMLAENRAYEAIVRHPLAPDKYILLIGAGKLGALRLAMAHSNLFNAWFDALIFGSPRITISKLEARADARSGK